MSHHKQNTVVVCRRRLTRVISSGLVGILVNQVAVRDFLFVDVLHERPSGSIIFGEDRLDSGKVRGSFGLSRELILFRSPFGPAACGDMPGMEWGFQV